MLINIRTDGLGVPNSSTHQLEVHPSMESLPLCSSPLPLPDAQLLDTRKTSAATGQSVASTPTRPARPPRLRRPQTAPYASSSSFARMRVDSHDPSVLQFPEASGSDFNQASPVSFPSPPSTPSSFLHRIPKPIQARAHRGPPTVSFIPDVHSHGIPSTSQCSLIPMNVGMPVADIRRRSANLKPDFWADADDRNWDNHPVHVWPESPTRVPLIQIRVPSATSSHSSPPMTASTLYDDSIYNSSIAEGMEEVSEDKVEKSKAELERESSPDDLEETLNPMSMPSRLLALLKFGSTPELGALGIPPKTNARSEVRASEGRREPLSGGVDEGRARKIGAAKRFWRSLVSRRR